MKETGPAHSSNSTTTTTTTTDEVVYANMNTADELFFQGLSQCFHCFASSSNITIKDFMANASMLNGCTSIVRSLRDNEDAWSAEKPTAQCVQTLLAMSNVDPGDLFNAIMHHWSQGMHEQEQVLDRWPLGDDASPPGHASSSSSSSLFPYSLLTTVLLTILYSATVILAILGNILVLIVMCCRFRSSFLDISIYLMNLSVFNLLMAIFCIPFTFINTILRKWVFSSFMCPFTSFIQMLSVNGCIFTLTALAINRFFAVAYPLKYNALKTKRQKRVSLIVVWLVSVGISCVQLFINKCYEAPDKTRQDAGDHFICKEVWDEADADRNARLTLMYTIWIFMQTYCIPVLILIVMYSRIIAILKNRNSSSGFLQESNCMSLHMNEQYEQIKIKTRKVTLFKSRFSFSMFRHSLNEEHLLF